MFLEVKNVTKSIHGDVVIKNVSLCSERGRVIGLRGINGSGKTMLMRLISGLIRPTKGQVLIDGEVVSKDIPFPKSLGVLIEGPAFLDDYSAMDNLKLIAYPKGKVTEDEIKAVLSEVRLDPKSRKKYKKFSLGMKQRLGIAAAVMEGKKINITDLAVGDGGGSYYKPNSTMTALKGEKWRGKVNRVEINEKYPNMIDVVAVIPSDVGGWTIREMGVLDEAETLIAVCNTPDTEKVIISSGAAGEIELTMHIEISNADAISFIIDPNVVTATKKDIEDHDASKTAHAAEFEKKADVTDLNAHANNTDIHVNPSTMGNYDTAISGLIEHKEDTKIHVTAEEKASWTEGAEQAAADANRVTEALNAIAGIESRVSRVEDGLFNNITGNPFLASFDSLDGITLVKGIWNEERKRIEC